jgi:hypothetical protein
MFVHWTLSSPLCFLALLYCHDFGLLIGLKVHADWWTYTCIIARILLRMCPLVLSLTVGLNFHLQQSFTEFLRKLKPTEWSQLFNELLFVLSHAPIYFLIFFFIFLFLSEAHAYMGPTKNNIDNIYFYLWNFRIENIVLRLAFSKHPRT